MPWSAPLFDDRKPKAEPDIYRVTIEHQSCRCYTEQVTRVVIAQLACQEIAKHGVYNPYRQPFGQGQQDQSTAYNQSARSSSFGNVLKSPARSGVPGSLGSDDLKVSGNSSEGSSAWPRPDFSYKVPFPGVGEH